MKPRDEPGSGPAVTETDPPTRAGWLRWVERALWAGLLLFLAIRLGPQLGALTGVTWSEELEPDFRAVTLAGDTIDSEGLDGRVAVVNFWATWCFPCRLEMPALQSLHEDFSDRDVVVLGASTDRGGRAGVEAFLEEHGISYPVTMATADLRNAFGGIPGLPTTFILDRTGTVQHRVYGYFAPPAMRAAVRRLLDE